MLNPFNKIKNASPLSLFVLFLSIYMILTGIIPSIIYHSIFIDSAQNMAWANTFSWGYSSHPPLGAWILILFRFIFRHVESSIFFASALCLILSLIYIYKTSRIFLNKQSAIIATMLSSLSYFYMVYFAIEYNQNTLMLLFWTMSAYYFGRALQDQKLRYWLTLAIISALAIITKYESALIIFIEGFYLLINFRRISSKKNLFIAFACFLVLLIPHLIWLVKNDFLPIKYFTSRTTYLTQNAFLYWHIYQPIKMVAAAISNILLPLLIFFIFYKRKKTSGDNKEKLMHYLVYLGWAPLCLVFMISAIFGMQILAEWAYPFFAFTLPGLFCFFSTKDKGLHLRTLTLIIIFIHCLNTAIYTSIIFSGKKIHSINYPGYSFAKEAQNFWSTYETSPIKYIGGVDSLAYYLAAYLPSEPALLNNLSFRESPWISPEQLKKNGVLLILPRCKQPLPDYWATQVTHKKCFQTLAANKFAKVPFEFALVIIPPNAKTTALP